MAFGTLVGARGAREDIRFDMFVKFVDGVAAGTLNLDVSHKITYKHQTIAFHAAKLVHRCHRIPIPIHSEPSGPNIIRTNSTWNSRRKMGLITLRMEL